MLKRITPALLQADRDTLTAATVLADYAPRNPQFGIVSAETAKKRNDDARVRVLRARAELAAALDEERDSGVAFHAIAIGMRDEVMVQYGANSDQYASIGRKKKSERKRPTRKPSGASETPAP